MMTDIFSSFDPSTTFFSSLSPLITWTPPFALLLMISASLWMSSNWVFWLPSLPLSLMSTQAHRTYGFHMKGFNTILCAMFIFLISLNLTGMIPYIFSPSSHLMFALSFGLPLWLMLTISSLHKAPKSTAALLLPKSTPNWLAPALILIETTSNIARPITLSFRLAANMTAGHVILLLTGVYSSSYLFTSMTLACLSLLAQTLYLTFELGICLIQAYVFCLLTSLYTDNHPAN